MAKPIQSLTIVGGGTSGWLAAAFLAQLCQNELRDGSMAITLIESPNIPKIGVGEASAPGLPNTFRAIGLDERKFIKEANATFKLSGYFDGWNVDAEGRPKRWVNSFMSVPSIAGRSPGYFYLKYGRGEGLEFSNSISACPEAIDAKRGPRPLNARDYESMLLYAYHMDAMVVADQLRDISVSLGVRHIRDDVTAVNLDERGYVASLGLKEQGQHPIEFVIDATGFAGLIINKALGEPFQPFDKYLVNDRAAVVQIPHEDPTQIAPITQAIAMSAGWRFSVPLYNRIGTGYIFSSKFTSDDEAITELKQHIGAQADGKDPRIIPMRIGKTRRSWVKNCVAIGLSSGFAEPLEATAIHSVDLAVRWLYAHFPDSDFSPALRKSYNRLVDEFYAEVIDFIVLHFHLNNRTDSEYWVAAREETPIPDSLAENLELWRHKMPRPSDFKTEHFFNTNTYLAALMGKGFYDDITLDLPGVIEADWRQFIAARRAQNQQIVNQLPGHYELLQNIRGETPSPPGNVATQPSWAVGPGAQPINFSYKLGK